MYITGGTGVGKSTQIPKLCLYALKAFDCKNNSKVMCTQPTIQATIDNSIRISNDLGIQINKYIKDPSGKQTNNFQIQYETQNKKHMPINDINTLLLKFTTDGTFIQQIKSNILMLKQKLDPIMYKTQNVM